ncbi:MAG: hypothetical protein KKE81_00750, partial [Candidatus Omnitrophica bacterium]|nr:hypothetical protein [Candidatus Omnitrophota bacterium]
SPAGYSASIRSIAPGTEWGWGPHISGKRFLSFDVKATDGFSFSVWINTDSAVNDRTSEHYINFVSGDGVNSGSTIYLGSNATDGGWQSYTFDMQDICSRYIALSPKFLGAGSFHISASNISMKNLRLSEDSDGKNPTAVSLDPKLWTKPGGISLSNDTVADTNVYQAQKEMAEVSELCFQIKPGAGSYGVTTVFKVKDSSDAERDFTVNFVPGGTKGTLVSGSASGAYTYYIGSLDDEPQESGFYTISVNLQNILNKIVNLTGNVQLLSVESIEKYGDVEFINKTYTSADRPAPTEDEEDGTMFTNPIAIDPDAQGAWINKYLYWGGYNSNGYGDSMLHKQWLKVSYIPVAGAAMKLYVKVVDKAGISYNLTYDNLQTAPSGVETTQMWNLAKHLAEQYSNAAMFDHVKYISLEAVDGTFKSIKLSDSSTEWQDLSRVIDIPTGKNSWVMNPFRDNGQDYTITKVGSYYKVRSAALSDTELLINLKDAADTRNIYDAGLKGKTHLTFYVKNFGQGKDYIFANGEPFAGTFVVEDKDGLNHAIIVRSSDLTAGSHPAWLTVTDTSTPGEKEVTIDLVKASVGLESAKFDGLRQISLRGGYYDIRNIGLWTVDKSESIVSGNGALPGLNNSQNWSIAFIGGRGTNISSNDELFFASGSRLKGEAIRLVDGIGDGTGDLMITDRDRVTFKLKSIGATTMGSDGRPFALDENFAMNVKVMGTDGETYDLKVSLVDKEKKVDWAIIERDLSELLALELAANNLSNVMIDHIVNFSVEGVQFDVKDVRFTAGEQTIIAFDASRTVNKLEEGKDVFKKSDIKARVAEGGSIVDKTYTVTFRTGGLRGIVKAPDANNNIIVYLGTSNFLSESSQHYEFSLDWILRNALGEDAAFKLTDSGAAISIVAASPLSPSNESVSTLVKRPDDDEEYRSYTINDWAMYGTLTSPAGTGLFGSDFMNTLQASKVMQPTKDSTTLRSGMVYNIFGQLTSYTDTSSSVDSPDLFSISTMKNITYDKYNQMINFDQEMEDRSKGAKQSVVARDEGTNILHLRAPKQAAGRILSAVYSDSTESIITDNKYIMFEVDQDISTDLISFEIGAIFELKEGQTMAGLGLTDSNLRVIYTTEVSGPSKSGDGKILYIRLDATRLKKNPETGNTYTFDTNVHADIKAALFSISGISGFDDYDYSLTKPAFGLRPD